MTINEVRNEYNNEPSRNLNMSDFTLGEQKDLILNLCLKYSRKEAEINDFKRILFPNDTKDDIKYLLILISEYKTEIVKTRKSRFDLHLSTNERTKPFIKNGGFTKIESELNSEYEYLKEKELLKFEVLKMQKENSEYQKSNRVKDEKIRELTIDNLRLGNWDIRFRWYIAVITFILGFIVKYFIDN